MLKKKVTLQHRLLKEGAAIAGFFFTFMLLVILLSYSPTDSSSFYASGESTITNLAGRLGAYIAAHLYYWLGYAAYILVLFLAIAAIGMLKKDTSGVYIKLIKRLSGLLLLFSTAGMLSLQGGAVENMPASAGGFLGMVIARNALGLLGVFGAKGVLIFLVAISLSLFTGLSWMQILEVIGGTVMFIAHKLKLKQMIKLPLIPSKRAIDMLAHRSRQTAASKSGTYDDKNNAKRIEPRFVFMPGHSSIKETNPLEVAEEKRQQVTANNQPALPPKLFGKLRSPAGWTTDGTSNQAASNLQGAGGAAQPQSQYQPPTQSRHLKYALPSLELLEQSSKVAPEIAKQDLDTMGTTLVTTLNDFGIKVELLGYSPGPVVTMFELQPAAGIKASKISNLSGDLARSLAVGNVRVVEFIRGKSCIGIEVPNPNRQIVYLRHLIDSKEFKRHSLRLPLALGQDIGGQTVIADLADMPHLLVAGTTGSGKSIGINAMLLSLLYKYSPKQLRLILVDPKMLELSSYNGIPHLLIPVITDMSLAAKSIGWCVIEMDKRYKKMAEKGVRNIAGYNEMLAKNSASSSSASPPKSTPSQSPPASPSLASPSLASNDDTADEQEDNSPMPYLVVVIDEYADMIMSNRKVEEHIVRLAQKARAAGIHLVLATQRPSVDVITGLIKANIPARISFKVSSRIDSRTVLDKNGAEQLLGKGDMLYMHSGGSLPLRVHGPLVVDGEVNDVTKHWKQQGEPEYKKEVLEAAAAGESSSNGAVGGDEEEEEFYSAAVDFVRQAERVSISSVQRKFKIGYNRAARIIEYMEKAGVVSEMDSGGKRVVLNK